MYDLYPPKYESIQDIIGFKAIIQNCHTHHLIPSEQLSCIPKDNPQHTATVSGSSACIMLWHVAFHRSQGSGSRFYKSQDSLPSSAATSLKANFHAILFLILQCQRLAGHNQHSLFVKPAHSASTIVAPHHQRQTNYLFSICAHSPFFHCPPFRYTFHVSFGYTQHHIQHKAHLLSVTLEPPQCNSRMSPHSIQHYSITCMHQHVNSTIYHHAAYTIYVQPTVSSHTHRSINTLCINRHTAFLMLT